jgi:hypothetical protein
MMGQSLPCLGCQPLMLHASSLAWYVAETQGYLQIPSHKSQMRCEMKRLCQSGKKWEKGVKVKASEWKIIYQYSTPCLAMHTSR